MSNFAKAMNVSYTWNGAVSHASPDVTNEYHGRLALFFKGVRGLNIPRLYEYLSCCAKENIMDTFLLAFNLRDCRGGKGERELGRKAMVWLMVHYPHEFMRVYRHIPEYGRWDDLLDFFPKCLDLTDLKKVQNNYDHPLLTEQDLVFLRSLQRDIVLYMAEQLKSDRDNMLIGKPCSLCAKWTPTEGDSRDKKNGVFQVLAKAVGVSCKNLRLTYNTPLRAYLNIVEKYMCSGKWDEVDFNKVPSQAMRKLKKAFEKHSKERFDEWKNALKTGETKVNAKQLHPHELVKEIREGKISEVTIAQWEVLVDEVKKLGSLKDTVVVVDTSSSMYSPNYVPLDVAVSMGMIISEVVEGPFHGHVISFNTTPKFTVVRDGDCYERYKQIASMDWGGSTNLQATFELILNRGKVFNLKQEDMPKRLFIISDMQFDQVQGYRNHMTSNGNTVTNMEAINDMYKNAGYVRPQIVFWNVNGQSTDFPVTKDENGTAMISGFSPAILKSLLKGQDYNPVNVLRNTLDDKRYDNIRKGLDINAIPEELAELKTEEKKEDDEYEIVD